MLARSLPHSLDRAGSGRTPTLPPAYRLPGTSLDAQANGRETKLHQALFSAAGHAPRSACVYRLEVTSEYAALDPGGAGVPGLAVS
jgi:hypothetical protein